MLNTPRPTPTIASLVSSLTVRRLSGLGADVDGGWPEAFSDTLTSSPVSNLSTAIIERFLIRSGNQSQVGSPPLFANRSRSVVKNPSDSYYSSNGYPNPPLGGIFRKVERNGTLGSRNRLELEPAYYIIKNAADLNQTGLVETICQFLDFMTGTVTIFGSTATVVSEYATYSSSSSSWEKESGAYSTKILALTSLAYYEAFAHTTNSNYRNKARQILSTVAGIIRANNNRAASREIPEWMRGAVMEGIVKSGNSYSLSWTRWSTEALSAVYMLLDRASQIEGDAYSVTDFLGNSSTLGSMKAEVGSFMDRFFEYPLIMRDAASSRPYLPYPLIVNSGQVNNQRYFVGSNYDDSGESLSPLGDTWFYIRDIMSSVLGMVRARASGSSSGPVGRFAWELLRLPPNSDYYWHIRYSQTGEALDHDNALSTSATALYGLMLLDGANPLPPPPKIKIKSFSGRRLTVETDKKSVIPIVRLPDGNILEHASIGPSTESNGFTYSYDLPIGISYVYIEEKPNRDYIL